LLAIALLQRPELGAQQAAIRQSMLALKASKWLPFSPNVIIGYSSGTFGGGSNTVQGTQSPVANFFDPQARFGEFGARDDLDVIMYWTAQNLGVGNVAMIRANQGRLNEAQLERIRILNEVREQVANAYVRIQARFVQMQANEDAIKAGERAFQEDMIRITGGNGLPLELLASLEVLSRARDDYVNSIVGYNRAQLEMYVALGQPPADMLARPVPMGAPLVPNSPLGADNKVKLGQKDAKPQAGVTPVSLKVPATPAAAVASRPATGPTFTNDLKVPMPAAAEALARKHSPNGLRVPLPPEPTLEPKKP
jgi:hypothetical protein